MTLPDVNVLIYAFRKDSEHHEVCRSWLERTILGESQFGVSGLTLSAVVRIATNPRVFREPSTVEESFAYCRAIMGQPHCELIEPGERHWRIFEELCKKAGVRGPKVSDAWFAALAVERGCTWITCDRDYARFPGLDWREPLK